MSDRRDEDTTAEESEQEIGITTDDRERIREFLEKPPHRRSLDDLRPDDSRQDT